MSPCFNPRTREGATGQRQIYRTTYFGFNPRTREGATSPRARGITLIWGFNPRTREGATVCSRRDSICRGVSIHAPVKVRPSLTG